MFVDSVSYGAALGAGLLSFFSPCVLPLIPAYFTFISGCSIEEITSGETAGIRKKVFFSTLSFVIGFSLVFVLMGASASYLGQMLYKHMGYIRIIGGGLIIVMGLHLIGLFRINFLNYNKRIHMRTKPLHIFGAFVVGMAFGAGWSPCTGPLLGSILILAGNDKNIWEGIGLLGVYSAGLAIPFLVLSAFVNLLLQFMRRTVKFLKYLNPIAGIMLFAIGLLLVTDNFYMTGVFN